MITGREINQCITDNYPGLIGKVYPLFTTVIDDLSVVYSITTVSGGYVAQDILQLRIFDSDYDVATEWKRKLINLFSTEKENKAVVLPTISFTGALSGGGEMFRDDLQIWEITAIFVLKTKERD
ncbi:hypothetical protein U1299_05545 [Enterococcus cecorum]|uniref:DUF3168 domain-containing protein n=1 Tax=Enterococcus cecorum TaxID=44008 RepID=A0AAW9JKK5_9ENTE|nr:hypothetical protein [Enterococcus cecorum]MCJ0572339.1 hypothetical protein [Enterococcus cecorum]MCJ0577237.1 hypothetical protein [Enterococcus cecorum]MCJ0584234.1 hypothetical protein [Enterococcus cecorum]MCJ0589553.1 hypothetical protein [Enterococcus cecorum]MDZ5504191.1 hypothetical protein [Enterococcus cecorum]